MMMGAVFTLRLSPKGVNFLAAGADFWYPWAPADCDHFGVWTSRYRQASSWGGDRVSDLLLALGREIFEWLDSKMSDALSTALAQARPPVFLEIAAPLHPDEMQLAFLDLPWELLADAYGHLAGRPDVRFLPVRRLGQPSAPAAPSPFRLSLAFMAAAPHGASSLNFEEEEAAIFKATGSLGLDLTVEETGSLNNLSDCLARDGVGCTFDVLHLSCHGGLNPPRLLFEDEVGDPFPVSADQLAEAFGDHIPRLLFLSACETASPEPCLRSLAPAMLLRGVPAVLGWVGSVSDQEAIAFAKALYGRLARHETLLSALVGSRLAMLAPEAPEACPSHDWHAARLYLGTSDGGALCQGQRSRLRDPRRAQRVFLDRRNLRIPVAGPLEFVGRRRQLQAIIRDFRQQSSGVLIHGLGRQGKSSLAARVAQRFDRHELVVLHGRYDATAILDGFAGATLDPESRRRIEDLRATVGSSPTLLETALRALLEGPFREEIPANGDTPARRPVLLVLDDFEQALEPDPAGAGPHRVVLELRPAIQAVLAAFRMADTSSRLLITSRFAFSLPNGWRDLAADLLHISLPSMLPVEGYKQAAAKLRAASDRTLEPEARLIRRVVDTARGNPGLQDLLFSLALGDPAICNKAVEAMASYLASGDLPEDQGVREFLEQIALVTILALLSPAQRELLRTSKLFEVAVPLETLVGLGSNRLAGDRLLALGLWEVQEDPAQPSHRAVALNALVAPRAGSLDEGERVRLATIAVADLFERWGGAARASWRGPAGLEVTRLALAAEDSAVLRSTAEAAIRTWEQATKHRSAVAWGVQALEILRRAQVDPPLGFLATLGGECQLVGEVSAATDCYRQALSAIDRTLPPAILAPLECAAVFLGYAKLLFRTGEMDQALGLLERTLPLLNTDRFARERAVTMGRIADLLEARGQLEEALRSRREEELPVYERFGDVRSRALTMDKIADVLQQRGEFEEALQIRREELPVFERLGDVRARAITISKIADVFYMRGEFEEALRIWRVEALPVYERLGDVRERALAMGRIAVVLQARGDLDEALRIRREEELPIYEYLGDVRARAVTMGRIADVLQARGDLDEALRIRREEELPVYEHLGDVRERAVTRGKIADVLHARGELDEALRIWREEELPVYERLGDVRERAATMGRIADVLHARGELDEALRIRREEELPVYERLGNVRERAVTMGKIADVLQTRGELDEALRIRREEELPVYERLGDVRERAVTVGKIADVLQTRGELDEALRIRREEELPIYERLGDVRERASTTVSQN